MMLFFKINVKFNVKCEISANNQLKLLCTICYFRLLGPDGRAGLDGLPGVKGEFGLTGLEGTPGPRGLTGTRGTKGQDGLPGLPGQKGSNGFEGRPGTSGLKGENNIFGLFYAPILEVQDYSIVCLNTVPIFTAKLVSFYPEICILY